jgi:hypothetical protein
MMGRLRNYKMLERKRPTSLFVPVDDRSKRRKFKSILRLSVHYSVLSLVLLLSTHISRLAAYGQTTSDKMVASITNGAQVIPDLISYSDLVWQIALEPGRPLVDKPSSEDLNRALRTLEDQLLVLQEARKLPLAETAQARESFDKEVQQKRDELAHAFGSAFALQERMSRVGLNSEQLDAILRDRVSEERYLDFRFRAFVLISPKEITDRYNQKYSRLRNSGRLVPTLDQVRSQIEQELTEEKIASEIDTFVDNLREQPGTEIVVISAV